MQSHLVFCFELLEAAVLGGIIGLERELAGKAAGLRTNLLICVGAALATHISISFSTNLGGSDPSRIAAQIVSGIGFIGAGAILQSRQVVQGLTTAATLWVVAGVGMAVGAGIHHDAILATALILSTLVLLGRLERRLFPHDVVTMSVRFSEPVLGPDALVRLVGGTRRHLRTEWRKEASGAGQVHLTWRGGVPEAERVAGAMARIPGVELEEWKVEE